MNAKFLLTPQDGCIDDIEGRRMKDYSMLTRTLVRVAIALPLINIAAGFSANATGTDDLHFGLVRGALLLLIILVVLAKHPAGNPVTLVMLSFFVYLFTLLLASSDISYSFNGTFIKVLSSMLLYVVGYHLIVTYATLQRMLKYFAIGVGLLCVNYLAAQVFKIGKSVYLEDSFYYGYAGVGSTVVLSYFILTLPLFDKQASRGSKLVLYLIMMLSGLFAVIAMKRVAILALMIGVAILVVMNLDFVRWAKRLSVAALIMVMTLPLYSSVLEERVAARTTERNELKNEARYGDIQTALATFLDADLKQSLFGTELFNSPGLFETRRQVHVDYANILIGAGGVGLTWYLLIHLVIWREFRRRYRKVLWALKKVRGSAQHMSQLHTMYAVFTALLVASLVVSLAGGMHVVTTRGIIYLLLGALTGVLQACCLDLFGRSPASSLSHCALQNDAPHLRLGASTRKMTDSFQWQREIGPRPA